MAKVENLGIKALGSPLDEETLAAIDEGFREDDSDDVVPLEEVRKLLPQWIAAASERKRASSGTMKSCSATDL